MTDYETEKFIVWSLSRYTMSYVMEHMDEVYREYLEDTKDASKNISSDSSRQIKEDL